MTYPPISAHMRSLQAVRLAGYGRWSLALAKVGCGSGFHSNSPHRHQQAVDSGGRPSNQAMDQRHEFARDGSAHPVGRSVPPPEPSYRLHLPVIGVGSA